MNFSKTPIGRLRLAGITEGISFLLLLFIAMPLKYFADFPGPVMLIGWIHGILFIGYVLALIIVWRKHNWSIVRTFTAFVASLIPFGTFVLDIKLRKEEEILLKR